MKEYMVVKGSEQALNVFERRVNSFMHDGWEPLGITCVHITDDILYRQTMTRQPEVKVEHNNMDIIRGAVSAQSLDEELWYEPTTMLERNLQRALRLLHVTVETTP